MDRRVDPNIHKWLGVGYGYQWRIGKALINGQTIEVLYASGHGGQKIFIIPQLDVVAVFTSKVFNPTGHTGPEKMLVKYILPAFIPTGESPEIVKLDSGLLDKLTGKYKIKNIDAVIPVVRKEIPCMLKPDSGKSLNCCRKMKIAFMVPPKSLVIFRSM